MSQTIVSISANSTDPDEMLHYVAFHLGLYFLPKKNVLQRVKSES